MGADRDDAPRAGRVTLTFVCIDGEIPIDVPLGQPFELPEAERLVQLLGRWRCHSVVIEPRSGRPGVVVALTANQAAGFACIRCGATIGTMEPVGRINGGSVALACHRCPTTAYVLEPFVTSSDVRTRI